MIDIFSEFVKYYYVLKKENINKLEKLEESFKNFLKNLENNKNYLINYMPIISNNNEFELNLDILYNIFELNDFLDSSSNPTGNNTNDNESASKKTILCIKISKESEPKEIKIEIGGQTLLKFEFLDMSYDELINEIIKFLKDNK